MSHGLSIEKSDIWPIDQTNYREVKFEILKLMRKKSRSLRKSSPSKPKKIKDCHSKCCQKSISSLNIQNSLSRKYSITRNFNYITCVNQILKDDSFVKEIKETEPDECLEKYCKSMNRKHIFPRIKEVYKLHT